MRWRFLDDGLDLAERDRKILDIDRWWSAFEHKVDALNDMFGGGEEWDLVGWMGELTEVHPDLMWEYGAAVNQPGHRLAITPEHRYELTELARTIIDRAPQVDGWEFYDHRLAGTPEDAATMVKSRTRGSLTDVRVAVTPGEDHLIDLHYLSKSPTATNDAFVATEALLGEQTLNRWVGTVTASKPPGIFGRGAPDGVPFPELADAFDLTRRKMMGQMKAEPHHEWVPEAARTVMQLQPEESDDYPTTEDVEVVNTASPELWRACHRGMRFDSERFSRQGERFLYVKMPRINPDARAALEDALDAVLVTAKLGCTTAGATGLGYSYIDVCVTNVEAGIRAMRTSLQASGVPDRTWILFCDRIWSDEWIAIYDRTPVPPGR